MAKHKNARKLKEALLDSKLTCKQRSLTLYTVSNDSEVAAIIDTAEMSKPSTSIEITIYHDNNQKEIFGLALEKSTISRLEPMMTKACLSNQAWLHVSLHQRLLIMYLTNGQL